MMKLHVKSVKPDWDIKLLHLLNPIDLLKKGKNYQTVIKSNLDYL